jgi:hypothetical protein
MNRRGFFGGLAALPLALKNQATEDKTITVEPIEGHEIYAGDMLMVTQTDDRKLRAFPVFSAAKEKP